MARATKKTMAAPFSVIFSRAFLVLKLVPKTMTDTFVILADGQDGQNNAKSGSNDAGSCAHYTILRSLLTFNLPHSVALDRQPMSSSSHHRPIARHYAFHVSSKDAMVLDSGAGPSADTSKRISTHGPRDSRREQWRLSKGMPARSISKGVNRQGGVAAKRKAGRSHRRR